MFQNHYEYSLKYNLYISTNFGVDWINVSTIYSPYLTNISIDLSSDFFIIYTVSPSDKKLYKYQYYIDSNSQKLPMNQLISLSLIGVDISTYNNLYDLTITNKDIFFGIRNQAANKNVLQFNLKTKTVSEFQITLNALDNDTKLNGIYWDYNSKYQFVISQKCIHYKINPLISCVFNRCENLTLINDNFVSIFYAYRDSCVYAITDGGTIYRSMNPISASASWLRYKIHDTGIQKIISSTFSDIVIVITDNTIYLSNSYGAQFKPYLREKTHLWRDVLLINNPNSQIILIGSNENIYYGNTDVNYENSIITGTIGGYTNSSRQPRVCVKSIINSEIAFEITDYLPTVDNYRSSLIINYNIN